MAQLVMGKLKKTPVYGNDGAGELLACKNLVGAYTWDWVDPKPAKGGGGRGGGGGGGGGGKGGAEQPASNSTTTATKGQSKKLSTRGRGNMSPMCQYEPATGSYLLCTANFADNNEKKMKNLIENLVETCAQYNPKKYTFEYFEHQWQNATKYAVSAKDANVKKPLNYPVIPDTIKDWKRYWGTQGFYKTVDDATIFAEAIYGYYLVLVIIGTIYNFVRCYGLIKWVNQSRVSQLIQSYVILPSLIPGGKYASEYGWKWFTILFPNRIQSLVDLLLFGLQFGFYFAPYNAKGNIIFGSDAKNIERFVADRTGIMAFGKIPLLILFSGRNNFLIWLTGWSYTTFLHFHKILSIWMTIDSIIHSVCYAIYVGAGYKTYLHRLYYACGVAATVLCIAMCLFAFHSLRRTYYEYFLIGHIIMAIGFIAMCWWHCQSLGWMEWMAASIAVWAFDRAFRVFRMLGFGYQKAQIEVVDEELLKITTKKPFWWTTESGQYGYIYFAHWIFWENHPFTMVCKNGQVIAYIKVKNGITKRIWQQLNAGNGVITKRICIEGPYGAPGSGGAKKMDEVLFFAGGSGAPAILDAAAHTSKGKLYWTVPTLSMAKAYSELVKDVNLPTEIYVTKEAGEDRQCSLNELFGFDSSDKESVSASTSSDGKDSCKEIDGTRLELVSIFYKRPDIDGILMSDITSSNESNVGVVGCGPPGMMDHLRNTLSRDVTAYKKAVNFYDELQVW